MHEVSRYVIVGCSVLVAVLAVNMTRGSDASDAPVHTSITAEMPASEGAALSVKERLSEPESDDLGSGNDQEISPQIASLAHELAERPDPELPEELELGFVEDGADALEPLSKLLSENPNNREALDRLSSLHARGIKREEVTTLVQELAKTHPSSMPLTEALADLYVQQGEFASAAQHFRKVVESTDQPMRVHTMLAYSLLKEGEFEQAIAVAKSQGTLAGDYASGRRDPSSLREKIDDEHIFVPCLLEAVARAKLGDPQRARQALTGCGEGVVSEQTRQHFQELGNVNIDDLRDKDFDEILD